MLRELRKRLSLTQTNFGRRIGVGTSSISDWERDLAAMPPERAMDVQAAFPHEAAGLLDAVLHARRGKRPARAEAA